MVKLIHEWLPVGHLISKYSPIYQASCPKCNNYGDFDHFLRCPGYSHIHKNLQVTLLKLNKQSVLSDIMCTGIASWISGCPFPVHQFPKHTHNLIYSQSRIGWKQTFLGRFSKHWNVYNTVKIPHVT